MRFPCGQKPNPCCESPLANFSSEDSDGPTFIAFNTGGDIKPPLGSTWNNPTGYKFCQARTPAEAILCGLNGYITDTSDDSGNPYGGDWRDPNGNPYPTFANEQQAVTAFCPDGSPFTFTVPAGRYLALDQVTANRVALSVAQLEVNLNKVCLGSLSDAGCVGTGYLGLLVVTGRGPFNFAVTSGSLPPGLTLHTTGPNSATISGNPTTPGNYEFQIQAENALGYFMRKTYVIYVLGSPGPVDLPDATENSAYSYQFTSAGGVGILAWSLIDGDIPAGLTLNINGLLSGTPTEGGTFDFTVEVVDEDLRSCSIDATLKVNTTVVGLIHYYKMDETNGTRVDQLATLDLPEAYGVVGSAAGIINKGAVFAGGAMGPQLRSAAILAMPQKLTISFWGKGNGSVGMIMDNYDAVTVKGQFLCQDFSIIDQGTFGVDAGMGGPAVGPGFTFTKNVWNFIVITIDLTTGIGRSYHNGVFNQQMAGCVASNTPGRFDVGGTNGNSQTFLGELDEIGIWDRILTDAEILALYNGGAGLAYGSPGFPP